MSFSDGNSRSMPVMSIGSHETVSYDSSTQTSAAVTRATVVRLIATTDVHIDTGVNPTATTSEMFLVGNTVDYLILQPGHKLAVIKAVTAGTLYVTYME